MRDLKQAQIIHIYSLNFFYSIFWYICHIYFANLTERNILYMFEIYTFYSCLSHDKD